jgi:hypothetical protein
MTVYNKLKFEGEKENLYQGVLDQEALPALLLSQAAVFMLPYSNYLAKIALQRMFNLTALTCANLVDSLTFFSNA